MFCVAPRAPRRALASLVLTAASLLTVTLLAPATPARASSSSDLVAYTNSARDSRGLGTLSVRSDLARVAQRQAAWMAANRTLAHSNNLGGQVCCWKSIGENVGMGSSARQIFNAFMDSSSHRANILSGRYTQIGVGAARSSDGRLWVAQVFRQPSGSTPTSTEANGPTPQRASRATSRAPLRVAPLVVRPSAEQLRLRTLASRVATLRPVTTGDPISRSIIWVDRMQKVTAR